MCPELVEGPHPALRQAQGTYLATADLAPSNVLDLAEDGNQRGTTGPRFEPLPQHMNCRRRNWHRDSEDQPGPQPSADEHPHIHLLLRKTCIAKYPGPR